MRGHQPKYLLVREKEEEKKRGGNALTHQTPGLVGQTLQGVFRHLPGLLLMEPGCLSVAWVLVAFQNHPAVSKTIQLSTSILGKRVCVSFLCGSIFCCFIKNKQQALEKALIRCHDSWKKGTGSTKSTKKLADEPGDVPFKSESGLLSAVRSPESPCHSSLTRPAPGPKLWKRPLSSREGRG